MIDRKIMYEARVRVNTETVFNGDPVYTFDETIGLYSNNDLGKSAIKDFKRFTDIVTVIDGRNPELIIQDMEPIGEIPVKRYLGDKLTIPVQRIAQVTGKLSMHQLTYTFYILPLVVDSDVAV